MAIRTIMALKDNYIEINSLYCCGVREIHALSKYNEGETAVKHIVNRWNVNYTCYQEIFAFLIFTQAGIGPYGQKTANYILEHKLGTITQSEPRNNPNSNRDVIVFTWAIDHRAVRAWGLKAGLDFGTSK